MYQNNEEFLRSLQEDYPDIDWDNLPDLDTYPDVYEVEGMQWRRLHFYAQEARASNNWRASEEKDMRDQIGIGFREMNSREEAEKLLAEILDPNSKWQKEEFHRHSEIPLNVSPDASPGDEEWEKAEKVPWSDEYFGPVVNETMHIKVCKSWEAVSLHIMASLRKQVLEKPDENHFPIYLP